MTDFRKGGVAVHAWKEKIEKLGTNRTWFLTALILLAAITGLANYCVVFYTRGTPVIDDLPIIWLNTAVSWICAILYLLCNLNRSDSSRSIQSFHFLVWLTGFTAALESLSYVVDRDPSTLFWNEILNLIVFIGSPLLARVFWSYISAELNLDSRENRRMTVFCNGIFTANFLMLILNVPFRYLYFIDATGTFQYGTCYILCFVYPLIQMLLSARTALHAKERPVEERLIMAAFPVAPIIGSLVEIVGLGRNAIYLTILFTLLLIYGSIYLKSENRRIQREVEFARETLRQQAELAEASRKANTDALTGVGSAAAFQGKIIELNRKIAEGSVPPFAIVEFDVNDLKRVNDTYGHDAGNIYLKQNCQFICKLFQHSPVYRVGGDEFIAILGKEDYAQRSVLLKQLDAQNRESQTDRQACERINFSFGLAVYDAVRDRSADEVFKRADTTLYRYKNALKGGEPADAAVFQEILAI